MTPETCSMQYKEAWDETHQPDPINTMMTTTLEKENSQSQADEKELISRVMAIVMAVVVTRKPLFLLILWQNR